MQDFYAISREIREWRVLFFIISYFFMYRMHGIFVVAHFIHL